MLDTLRSPLDPPYQHTKAVLVGFSFAKSYSLRKNPAADNLYKTFDMTAEETLSDNALWEVLGRLKDIQSHDHYCCSECGKQNLATLHHKM